MRSLDYTSVLQQSLTHPPALLRHRSTSQVIARLLLGREALPPPLGIVNAEARIGVVLAATQARGATRWASRADEAQQHIEVRSRRGARISAAQGIEKRFRASISRKAHGG